jgi:hypothetical protein
MDAASFRKIVQGLPKHGFYSRKLGKLLQQSKSASFSPTAKHQSQKEHWLGWLNGYDGPGAYIRSTHSGRKAQFIYNRIQNSSMLLYLPEALGISKKLIKEAFESALKADAVSMSRQCGAIRKVIPWDEIEKHL